MENFSLAHTTRSAPPLNIQYGEIKNLILKKNYKLSLVFVGTKKAKNLNTQYRNKTYIPDILSFPLDRNTGEIYICLPVVKKKAHSQKMSLKSYVLFLYIHGLLHLKGFSHGVKMDTIENRLMKQFS